MNELREYYQRKINTINELLKDSSNSEDTINRLKIKVGCYRSFLTELNRALNIDLVSKCDCSLLVACEICGEEKNLDGDFWKNKKKHDC